MERRSVIFVGTALVATCAAVWGGVAIRDRMSVHKLADTYADAYATARSLQIKTSTEELLEDIPKLGPDDASALVSLMVDKMGKPTASSANGVIMGQSIGLDTREFLRSKAKLIDMAREISTKQTFAVWRTQPDPEDLVGYQLPVSLTTGLILLAMSATSSAEHGEYDTCIRDLQAMSRYSALLTSCPSNASYNSRLNGLSLLIEAVRRSALVAKNDPGFLGRLRVDVIDQCEVPDPRPAARHQAFLTIRQAEVEMGRQNAMLLSLGITPQVAADWSDPVFQKSAKSLMLRSWIRIVQGMDKSWPNWSGLVACVKESYDLDRPNRGTATHAELVARGFAPAIVGAITTAQNTEARRRITGAWLAVLEHHARDGEYPDQLPAPYDDPYDNEPLRYKKIDGGFQVYAVGSDGVDDGGATESTSGRRASDIGIDGRPGASGVLQGH